MKLTLEEMFLFALSSLQCQVVRTAGKWSIPAAWRISRSIEAKGSTNCSKLDVLGNLTGKLPRTSEYSPYYLPILNSGLVIFAHYFQYHNFYATSIPVWDIMAKIPLVIFIPSGRFYEFCICRYKKLFYTRTVHVCPSWEPICIRIICK